MAINVEKYVNVDSQDTPIIRYVEKLVYMEKYGIDINGMLGDVDENGVLGFPTGQVSLVFNGVKSIPQYVLYNKFYNYPNIVSVEFPDLEIVDNVWGLYQCFRGCSNLITASFPKVKELRMPSGFQGCSGLENVYMPELEIMVGMGYTFYGTNIKNINLPKVKRIQSANSCFYDTKLESIDLSSVESIVGSNAATWMLASITDLKSANLSGVRIIDNDGGNACASYLFYNDQNLESVDMSNLEEVHGGSALEYAFAYCPKLKTMRFDKLNKIGLAEGSIGYSYYEFRYAFQNSGIESLYFPALDSNSFTDNEPFSNMLRNVTGCVVHFPSNIQSVIGGWADVINGFGGTNTTVLFDLPNVE